MLVGCKDAPTSEELPRGAEFVTSGSAALRSNQSEPSVLNPSLRTFRIRFTISLRSSDHGVSIQATSRSFRRYPKKMYSLVIRPSAFMRALSFKMICLYLMRYP